MKLTIRVLALAVFLAFPAIAAAQQPSEPTPRIVVSGTGEAALAPDMAILSLSVMREAQTARQALDANNEAMASVIAAMKEAGVADRDLQTAGFSINPRYVYPQNSDRDQQPRIVAYQVVNTLTVRIRDLAQVGALLDRSVTLGVNQGGRVSFVNEDTTAALAEARGKAMADAIAKVQTLAEAAGVRAGKILEISEQSGRPRPVPLARAMAADAAPEAVPVQSGENRYSVTVNVVFAIEQ